jgi:hypothetical protein
LSFLLDESVFDLDFLELVTIEIFLDSFSYIILVGFESVEIFASSDFKLGDSFVLLD